MTVYNYKKAIKDCDRYLKEDDSMMLYELMEIEPPSFSTEDLIERIDEVYELCMNKFICDGLFDFLYKKFENTNDVIYIPPELGSRIIPTLVLLSVFKNPSAEVLEPLRGLIKSLIDICGKYIKKDNIEQVEYEAVKSLVI